MQRLLTLAVLALAIALQANPALALGFGRVIGGATLGQPLDLSVVLRLDTGESIEADCIKAAVTSGDRRLPSGAVRTRVDVSGNGERRLRIVTTLSIDEPIVALDLTAGCPPKLSRQFVVFADPPGAVAAEPAPLSPPVAQAAEMPVASASAPARETAPRRARRERASPTTTASSAGTEPAVPARSAPRQASRRATAERAGGPVLRLDPIEEEALAVPMLRMATELAALPTPGASRPALSDPEAEALRQNRERMATLEATLKRLQGIEQQRAGSLAQAEARLREARAERYANPLVYGLVAVAALLLLALLWLAWRMRHARQQAAWWQAASALPEAAPGPEPEAAPLPEPLAAPAPPVLVDEATWDPGTVRLTPSPHEPPAPAPMARAERPARVSDETEPRRPMSAEELIDLEQQAEFFVVLGQDDAAIDLLMSHLRSTGGVSPVPYLKLLEIYRRRGEQDSHERIRERFNRRFNAYAPEWHVDPDSGQSLENYPEVLARLQAAWGSSPAFAMELLDSALFRRDNGPTFDVPAYRELLFLYSVARDLAERAIESDGVDFLLPLDEPRAPAVSRADVSAAEPGPASPPPVDDMLSLDLDVTLDETPPAPQDRRPRNT